MRVDFFIYHNISNLLCRSPCPFCFAIFSVREKMDVARAS